MGKLWVRNIMKVFITSEESFVYCVYNDDSIADIEIDNDLYKRYFKIQDEWEEI